MKFRLFRISRVVIDFLVLASAFAVAFLLRFELAPPADFAGRLLLTLPYVVVGEYAVLWMFGIPKCSWRYVGLPDVKRIAAATLVSTSVLVAVRVLLDALRADHPYLRHGVIPWSVLATNGVLMLVGVLGVRVLRRAIGERLDLRRVAHAKTSTPAILVGAGQAGALVSRELSTRPDVAIRPIGFVDDDLGKTGTLVNGIPVLGTIDQLPELCERHGARQVVITIGGASGPIIRRITELADRVGVPVQIIPGLYEIVDGRVNLSRARPVAIEDLLRREPVVLDNEAIANDLRGRVVLITGAGGSIGSELARQVARFEPSTLLLLEKSENGLFHIHREIIAEFPALDVVPLVADVTDAARMRAVFATYRPETVYHAAAHKHVPLMEANAGEAIRNNVVGTRILADAAHEHGVRSFVMISTDKAVNPTSVMGATKRVAEIYVQALAHHSSTRFVTVRFGNVLGSAGSVVPIFREQIAKGGPVTVTHPDMKRYFMTIPEACQLVMQAGSMGNGGEIFILDMGEPVRIVDLARDLIQLSGLKVDEDIAIEFSGIRPGEKLFEELSVDVEHADKTQHPKIFIGRAQRVAMAAITAQLDQLENAIYDNEQARAFLRACVPEYSPSPAPAQPDRARLSERPGLVDAVHATAT